MWASQTLKIHNFQKWDLETIFFKRQSAKKVRQKQMWHLRSVTDRMHDHTV